MRDLLPDARYILIVRDPMTNFESVVRMWRKMFETYAFGSIPADDEIREAVLADRLRFESKLADATSDLAANRFAVITYEALVADPLGRIEDLYAGLELGDIASIRNAVFAELDQRSGYRAKGALPSGVWQDRIHKEWAAILSRYGALCRS